MQGINDLGFPTINGLKSLNLDELETTVLNANTIDGNIIYYNRIEGNEIIVDTKLTLTNTGVIAVGDKFISDIELTYLDGVSSNIQTQINNINTDNSNLETTVNNHTTQITALQTSDTAQNTAITNLQTTNTSQNTAITDLQTKTQNMLASGSATTMSKPLYLTGTDILRLYGNHSYISGWSTTTSNRDWVIGTPNVNIKQLLIRNEKLEGIYLQAGSRTGNTNLGQNKIITNSNGISLRRGGITAGDTEITVGEIGALTDGNLRINGTSTNNIILSSGIGEISCESNLLRVGATTANANGRKSNILMYDATGNNWETQSSAFTETLKSQISTNSSNITILQTSNSSLNSSISELQTSDTAQNTAITNLQTTNTTQANQITLLQEDMLDIQNTESAQSAQLAALQLSDSSQNTAITALQTKTQNISFANSYQTHIGKQLNIYANGLSLNLIGTHNYIGGNSGDDWIIGREFSTDKKLSIRNTALEGIYITTGPGPASHPQPGYQKIVTRSGGLQFKQGGNTNNDVIIGEIGGINLSNSNFYINNNGINEIYINSGLGGITLSTNVLWIGSGNANANGRYSNINMLTADGNNWETQSSAFTEALKARLLTLKDFNNGTGKIEFIAASLWWVGQAYNVINFAPSTLYQPSGTAAKKNVGEWLYAFSGYSSMFGSNGAYLLTDKPNLTLVFEMDFSSNFSSVQALCSRIIVENSAGTVLSETFFAGVRYNSERDTHNMNIYYNTAPLRHILNQGDKIFVDTVHNILTPNSSTIASVVMKGKFSMMAN